MRTSRLPLALHVTTWAVLLVATPSVFAQSPTSATTSLPTTTTTTTSSSSSSSSSDDADPHRNSIHRSHGLSGSVIAGLCAVGGFLLIFSFASALFIWNRRADRKMRTMPDVQNLVVLSSFGSGSYDDEEAGMVKHAGMAGPLGSPMIKPYYGTKPVLTSPRNVYSRKDSAGSSTGGGKKRLSSDVSELDAGGRDWVESMQQEETILRKGNY